MRTKLPALGFVAAETVSLLGNQLATVAIPVLVLTKTGSPVAVGVASAATILPIVLAALVGGRLIDSLGAWRMSVVSDILSCLSVLALPLAYRNDGLPLLALFALVLLGALFDPTGVAARQALVPQVAKRAGVRLETLNGWRGVLENGADFLGPGLAGLAIALLGVTGAFYLNAGTFFVCALLFALSTRSLSDRLGPKVVPQEGEAATLSGLSFLFATPDLRALSVCGFLMGFGLLPFLSVLLPVVAVEGLGSAPLLAAALTGFGIAATVGAAGFALLARHASRRTIYYGGILLTGIAIGLTGLARTPLEVILCATLAGLLLGAGNPLQQTLLQERTPEPLAGRVFTTMTATQFLGGPLGLVLAGWVAGRYGVEPALGACGLLLVGVALVGWVFLPLGER